MDRTCVYLQWEEPSQEQEVVGGVSGGQTEVCMKKPEVPSSLNGISSLTVLGSVDLYLGQCIRGPFGRGQPVVPLYIH